MHSDGLFFLIVLHPNKTDVGGGEGVRNLLDIPKAGLETGGRHLLKSLVSGLLSRVYFFCFSIFPSCFGSFPSLLSFFSQFSISPSCPGFSSPVRFLLSQKSVPSGCLPS